MTRFSEFCPTGFTWSPFFLPGTPILNIYQKPSYSVLLLSFRSTTAQNLNPKIKKGAPSLSEILSPENTGSRRACTCHCSSRVSIRSPPRKLRNFLNLSRLGPLLLQTSPDQNSRPRRTEEMGQTKSKYSSSQLNTMCKPNGLYSGTPNWSTKKIRKAIGSGALAARQPPQVREEGGGGGESVAKNFGEKERGGLVSCFLF